MTCTGALIGAGVGAARDTASLPVGSFGEVRFVGLVVSYTVAFGAVVTAAVDQLPAHFGGHVRSVLAGPLG